MDECHEQKLKNPGYQDSPLIFTILVEFHNKLLHVSSHCAKLLNSIFTLCRLATRYLHTVLNYHTISSHCAKLPHSIFRLCQITIRYLHTVTNYHTASSHCAKLQQGICTLFQITKRVFTLCQITTRYPHTVPNYHALLFLYTVPNYQTGLHTVPNCHTVPSHCVKLPRITVSLHCAKLPHSIFTLCQNNTQ